MIIVSISYVVPVEEVEKHFDAHITWLQQQYEAGVFVASGRKVPRSGGVILAKGTPDAVRDVCEQDPFIIAGVAKFELTEVNFTRTIAAIEGLKD